jgi:hypothetical protein
MKINFGFKPSRGCELWIRTKTKFAQHLAPNIKWYSRYPSIRDEQFWRQNTNTREQMDRAFISCSWYTKRYTWRSPFCQPVHWRRHTEDKSQNDLLNLDCHTFLPIKGRHGLCSIIVFYTSNKRKLPPWDQDMIVIIGDCGLQVKSNLQCSSYSHYKLQSKHLEL